MMFKRSDLDCWLQPQFYQIVLSGNRRVHHLIVRIKHQTTAQQKYRVIQRKRHEDNVTHKLGLLYFT